MDISFKDFKFVVGEIIAFCQTIEYDLKVILASVFEGDYKENFEAISRWTLGQIVNQLEEFEIENETEYFDKLDYRILKDLTKKRNYICHEIFRTFVYKSDFINSKEYELASIVLLDFHSDVVKLAKKVEKVRLSLN